MRKSFDGLAALASGSLALDSLSGHLFVFVNKRRDRIKILYWDRDGLAVWAKRLERGTFRIPAAAAGRVEMTTAELAALLAGIDLNTARRRVRYSPARHSLQNSENNCRQQSSTRQRSIGYDHPRGPTPGRPGDGPSAHP